MNHTLFGVGPRVHHHEQDPNYDNIRNANYKLHLELEHRLAVPPSLNTYYKFLHAINGTTHNNMRPAVGKDGTGLAGCWLIHKTIDEVDDAWKTVKHATEVGQLGYRSNVRTVKDNDDLMKTISVCTYNAFDISDVLRVRKVLKSLGFTAEAEEDKLEYKTLGQTEMNIHYEDHQGGYVSLHKDFKIK